MSSLAVVSAGPQKLHSYAPHISYGARGLGEESDLLAERLRTITDDFTRPFSRFWSNPAVQFEVYREQWEDETRFLSSSTEMAMNSSYQKIIGMGEKALPLILADLRRKPNHWFWALRSITGEDPVRPEQRGRIKLMTQAWLQWGKERDLI